MEGSIPYALLIIWYAFEWVLRIVALFVVPRNRNPTAGTSWLLFIFLVPTVGWLVFLVFGSSRLPRHRRDAQVTLDRYITQAMRQIVARWRDSDELVTPTPPAKYASSIQLSEALTHLPLLDGNRLEAIDQYEATIDRMIKDINAAQQFVHLEYYIIAYDEVTIPLFDALAAARQRGVKVRVLYDAFGSRKFTNRQAMVRRLAADDIEVHAMLPFRLPGKGYTRPDLRNHRKLTVVDGTIGYTGSLNMIKRNYHRRDDIVYDEMTVRVEGPAVLQLEAVFLNDWYAETGQILRERHDKALITPKGTSLAHVIPSGPGYEYHNNLKFFASLFYAARAQITIVNPYFVPDQSLISALISAVQRGVKVRIVNSAAIDQLFVAHAQRSYYEQLLRAGVEIYLYKKPALLHAKFTVIDDDACLVGSSNMDIRSFELNQELTLTAYDPTFVTKMQAAAEGYIARSTRVNKQQWLRRPPRKQLLDNIARLTSSLQ